LTGRKGGIVQEQLRCAVCGESAYFVLANGRDGFCTVLHMHEKLGAHIRWVAEAVESGVRSVRLLTPLTDPEALQPRQIN
jgi:hypothetical protein